MTGSQYKAGLVALLFAIHPLNVESVAWVAERKTLLSSFFFISAICSYIYYVENSRLWVYCLTLALFACGLMSKPSIIVFPLLLLVLDYWPLRRYSRVHLPIKINNNIMCTLNQTIERYEFLKRSNMAILIIEKVPFIFVSIVSFYISMNSMSKYNIVIDFNRVPLDLRVYNLFVSIQKYLLNMVLPLKLSIFYPFPKQIDLYDIMIAMILIAFITFIAYKYRNSKPWIMAGWLWFLMALAPASGLVQAGLWPEMANRFMYIPMIGIFTMLVWTYDQEFKWKYITVVSTVLIIGLFTYFTSMTRIQNIYYSNSYALFSRAIEVTTENFIAYNNVGTALNSLKRDDEAIKYFYKALTINPEYENALNNYALLLSKKGDYNTAAYYYKKAIALHPNRPDAYVNLALNQYLFGMTDEAVMYLEKILLIDQNNANAHSLLGKILLEKGRTEEAINHYSIVIKKTPRDVRAKLNLAQAYENDRRYEEAIDLYRSMIIDGVGDEGRLYYQMAVVKSLQKQVEESIKYIKLSSEKGYNVYEKMKTDNRFNNNIKEAIRYK